MLVDSHCHLNYKGLIDDQPAVLARARAAGVTAMLNISTRASEWDAVIGVAEREPDVWASVGIHPHEADVHPDVETGTLVERAKHPRVIGIGESGLDFYYDHSDRDRQRESFRAHIAAARETGLPIIVHTRDAEDDTYRILADEMGKGAYRGVIHCFTASADFARKALDLGFYISLSGIVTFKNAKDLQATARDVPQDRLLIETDAPFLAPVPHRGKPCEPAFVADTARFLAGLRERPPRVSQAIPPPISGRSSARLRCDMKVRILGCGTSSGVPRVGNDWGACDPADPRNRRRRVSILVEHADTRILVDTGPDLREQLLDAGVADVDAVLWTHDHADHCHGIDDLRQLYHARGTPIAGYARQETLDTLHSRFGYIFEGKGEYPPVARLHLLPDSLEIGAYEFASPISRTAQLRPPASVSMQAGDRWSIRPT
jgi:TatD DNase family protein